MPRQVLVMDDPATVPALLSGLPAAELAALAEGCGVDGYLTKARPVAETVAAVMALLP